MSRKRFILILIATITASGALFAWGFLHISPSGNLSLIQTEVRAHFPDVKQLSTDELTVNLLDSNRTSPVLFDVRSKDEYDISHLKGARLVDPDADPDVALAGVSKDAEIVVYCSVGWRSSKYAQKLQSNQYKNVFNLEGSIFKWANEGRPVYNEYKQVETVHPYDRVWGRLLKEQFRADLNKAKE